MRAITSMRWLERCRQRKMNMREEFERWYLQVVRGHPNNLTRDESGGYKYLAAMYLGWEAATLIEREKCARTCEDLWKEEATAAAAGTLEPKYHDCIECAHAIRERSNAKVTGASPHEGT